LSPGSSRPARGAWLAIPTALAMVSVAGCQNMVVVEIGLNGPISFDQVAAVDVDLHEVINGSSHAGGYVHTGTSNVMANQVFRERKSVSVYLPPNVRRFLLRADLYYQQSCPFLSGTGEFDLDAVGGGQALDMRPAGCSSDADNPDQMVSDSSPAVGEAGDAADVVAEEASASSPDAGADHGECDDTAAPSSCPDLSDGGTDAGAAFVEQTPNSECEGYCNNMVPSCPGVYADLAGCLAVCTEARWHLPADGGPAVTLLSCLAAYAQSAADARTASARLSFCEAAEPGNGSCGLVCETYCALREKLCRDPGGASQDCLDRCHSMVVQQSRRFACLLEVLETEVLNDSRFCSWTSLDTECGRCASAM
jgi:hypothetical protein